MDQKTPGSGDAAMFGSPADIPVPAGAIGEQAAKAVALAHAGLTERDTQYIVCHPEIDHGRMEHYDVKFQAGNRKYKYAIGVLDGVVLGRAVKDKSTGGGYVYEGNYHEHMAPPPPPGGGPGMGAAPPPGGGPGMGAAPPPGGGPGMGAAPPPPGGGPGMGAAPPPPGGGPGMGAAPPPPGGGPGMGAVPPLSGSVPGTGGMIGQEQAFSIALAAAGLVPESLEKQKCKLVTKHGRTIYRMKLKARGMEAEIDVDAYTGAVTKAHQEPDF